MPLETKQIKESIKKIKFLRPGILHLRQMQHYILARHQISKLARAQSSPFAGEPASNLIVSLTSFPPRIEDAWITIESIFQQTYRPWKIVLVLAESEFPNRA